MSDIAKMADDVFVAVKTWVSRSIDPLQKHLSDLQVHVGDLQATTIRNVDAAMQNLAAVYESIAAVEKQIKAIPAGPQGDRGDSGIDGKDAEPIDVAAVIAEIVKQVPAPANGADGKDGIDGTNGKDAEPVDVAAVIAEVVKQVPAPANGTDGKDGRDGIDGKDAQQVDIAALVAEVLKQIPMPKDGISGKDGADGRDGLEGAAGRDAWQIDVLESIDPQRKYQRGTYVSYRGGEISSVRATDPIDLETASWEAIRKAGWKLSRDGVADIEDLDSEDLRTVGYRVVLTSGRVLVRERKMPVILDRGVFKAGDEYTRGDMVTWGGSTWIAQVEEPVHKPGEVGSSDWRLSVKCGRDGKDGAQGKQGEAGRHGRDLTPFGARA